ncbi:putative signal transduction protein with EAL and GGDEF domain [Bradyrhizobium sp. USDA 4473]
MHSLTRNDFQAGAAATGEDDISSNELRILRDLLQLLPAGVTVQDEHGQFILVNEAAASQLQLAASATQPPPVDERHAANLDLLRSGRPVVLEEVLSCGASKYVFLTAHRPVQIAGRNLLISASTDISEQKAFEDQLFRSAYYDELTSLPTRRVIEHRVNGLIRDDAQSHFALAFLDVDNFKHINDYYGHAIGDALLVELSKRLGHALRDTDILSRISGDEFLLLLNPDQQQ